MSLAVTVVEVKSVTVELRTCVPEEIETPEVLIEFELVGIAVPVAFFHVFTVHVPSSTDMEYPVIVPAYGI